MQSNKKVIGILFGGKSAEHEVSVRSARSIFNAIDKTRYLPYLIAISKTGHWYLLDSHEILNSFSSHQSLDWASLGQEVCLPPQSEGLLWSKFGPTQIKLDIVFPVLHGTYGEDGTVQGLLRLADVPFAGCDVLGSAVGMDKEIAKCLLAQAGLPIAKYAVCHRHARLPEFASLVQELGLPLFVKPANLGSSVGISKVKDEASFLTAMKLAFEYDVKVIIEEFIQGIEVECSVLGNENPVASLPGEVIPGHDFYSYEAKYLDPNGATTQIPANLPPETILRLQELAVSTFKTLQCSGLSRVDFFVTNSGQILVNEINTMPGFTTISMYPKMWEASGLNYPDLVDRIIDLAFARYRTINSLNTDFESHASGNQSPSRLQAAQNDSLQSF